MKVEKSPIEDALRHAGIGESDTILYMGGRIDDNNLYPPSYCEYLNKKIQSLKPTKIICHNHWYAKKYYEKQILTKNTNIDIIFAYYHYVNKGKLQTINPIEYSDHRSSMKLMIDKNPNVVYAFYISQLPQPSSIDVKQEWFTKDYKKNNIKYFCFNRQYSPSSLVDIDLGHGAQTRNASDGFGCILELIRVGFKNINILGFSAFGSDEDMTHHTAYTCNKDPIFLGRKLFNLGTSEDLRAESDIMCYWDKTSVVKNIENYNKMLQCLKE